MREIEDTLSETKAQWVAIERALLAEGVGKKDTAFDDSVMTSVLLAYEFLDYLLSKEIDIFQHDQLHRMCAINETVLYGQDARLKREHRRAILANRDKFHRSIPAVYEWYAGRRSSRKTAKIAAKVYASILGVPQVFTEGNHRTGALIASWINVTRGSPPFVLSPDNAVAFFHPSSQIKRFSATTYWRGRYKLPKYHHAFKRFWVAQTADGGRFLG
jgi:hypothetical protein